MTGTEKDQRIETLEQENQLLWERITDKFLEELLLNTEGKTDCKFWKTDNWGG